MSTAFVPRRSKRDPNPLKIRAKIRHVFACASGVFPIMAAFVFIRSRFQHELERAPYNKIALLFFVLGMFSLVVYGFMRSNRAVARASRKQKVLSAREEQLLRELESRADAEISGLQ